MRVFPIWDILCQDPYTSLIDALLKARGLSMGQLEVGPEQLHNPQLLTDLERGVQRIERAVRQREKIVVFGDYDVDGVTSTALLLDCLEHIGAPCDYILPDRHRDGYGIKPPGVGRAMEKGAGLVVTVDNGISAHEALACAAKEGLDVVVVDHHQQHGELPPAHSVINPNRLDCNYPFKGLAGVGVAFKVVQALTQVFMEGTQRRRYLNELLDLVVLGTVADVMPVLDENRVLIQRGLKVIEATKRPGLRHLKAVARCNDRPIDTTAVGFYLGPRINVAGRLATPDLALKLLRAPSDTRAVELAGQLNSLNSQRQRLQREGMKEAEALVDPEDLARDRIAVLLGEGWKLGVIGLIASKVAEKYSRPAVVCTDDKGDGTYVGSARSMHGYDIAAGISSCAQHLIAHGGHAGAAGFSLQAADFEGFRAALIDHANAHIDPGDLKARLEIDLVIRPEDIGGATLEGLARLEPFGNGHRVPVFALRHCKVVGCQRIGKDANHLKLGLEVGGRSCTALWWNQGAAADQLTPGQRVSTAFVLEADNYAGNGAVQLVLKDMHLE